MKVFVGEPMTCGLNYQPHYIYSELSTNFDITKNPKEADIIIFPGTCACTEKDIFRTINYINEILKLKKENAKTYLTGCLSRKFTKKELFPVEEYLKNNIDYIIPQNSPNKLLKMIGKELYKNKQEDFFGAFIMDFEEKIGYIHLSSGCLNNCSFCKKTYQDLPLKSTDFKTLKNVILEFSERGITTISLKGTNISQYGLDINGTYMLKEVIDYIETVNNIKNIELIGFAFKDAIKGNFAKTFARSSKIKIISGGLESGSNRILRMMNKGFTSEEFTDFVEKSNIKNSLILNIIAGFPTETIEDVNLTLDLLKKINPYINKVDVIKYINSSYIDSNQYKCLEKNEQTYHAETYQKVLSKSGIYNEIINFE